MAARLVAHQPSSRVSTGVGDIGHAGLVPSRHFVVPEAGALVGRREECDICLNGPTVSGQQCRLRRSPSRGGRFILEDLSSNGTFVNGRRVGKNNAVELNDGDTIQLTSKVREELMFRFETGIVARASVVGGGGGSAGGGGGGGCGGNGAVGVVGGTALSGTAVATAVRQNVQNVAAAHVLDHTSVGLVSVSAPPAAAVVGALVVPAVADAAPLSPRSKAAMPPPVPPARTPPQQAHSSEQMTAAMEAEREAERLRLLAQRRVLVSELAEQQAISARGQQQLAAAEANAARQRELRERLFDEHHQALRLSAQRMGDIEALRIFLKECEDVEFKESETLARARSQAATLEAQLSKLRDEARTATGKHEHVERKFGGQEARIARVRGVASDFAEELRCHAGQLAEHLGILTAADVPAEQVESTVPGLAGSLGCQWAEGSVLSIPPAIQVAGTSEAGANDCPAPAGATVESDMHVGAVALAGASAGKRRRRLAVAVTPVGKENMMPDSPADVVVVAAKSVASPRGRRSSGAASSAVVAAAASARRLRRRAAVAAAGAASAAVVPTVTCSGVSDSAVRAPSLAKSDATEKRLPHPFPVPAASGQPSPPPNKETPERSAPPRKRQRTARVEAWQLAVSAAPPVAQLSV